MSGKRLLVACVLAAGCLMPAGAWAQTGNEDLNLLVTSTLGAATAVVVIPAGLLLSTSSAATQQAGEAYIRENRMGIVAELSRAGEEGYLADLGMLVGVAPDARAEFVRAARSQREELVAVLTGAEMNEVEAMTRFVALAKHVTE